MLFSTGYNMGKSQKERRRLSRNNKIKSQVRRALRKRPPGPKRPMTSDWILRLRDNALRDHGGDPSQTLKLVKRVCHNWGKVPGPRTRKCTVTGGANLQLAVESLALREQSPAELRRTLRRQGVTKLSSRSAITLHSKATPLAIALRARREEQAEFALRRRQRFHYKWVSWTRRLRRQRAIRAAKREQHCAVYRWGNFTRKLLAKAEKDREDALFQDSAWRAQELTVLVPLWRTLVKGIIESPGFQQMWNAKQETEWPSELARQEWLNFLEYQKEKEERRKVLQRVAHQLAWTYPRSLSRAWRRAKLKVTDRETDRYLRQTLKLTAPEATLEQWSEAAKESAATKKVAAAKKRPKPRTRKVAVAKAVTTSGSRRSGRPKARARTASILHPLPYR